MASLSKAPHMESFMSFPPGFKFCPTDEELIHFYLRKKANNEKLPHNPIVEENIYLHSPKDLAVLYKDYEGYNGLYFFTPRDRKYPNGKRPNRSAKNGYWKATGADKKVCHEDQIIGYKKTLVFYQGKPPKGTKTDWIMHEYTLKEPLRTRTSPNDMKLDDGVLCKIYERKKRLDDAEDNDQNTVTQVPQFSTSSSYPSLPLPQLPPQALQLPPPVLSKVPQQTPLPLSQLPQLVASPCLQMDAHEVNMYSSSQLSAWNNPQAVLLPPPALSQTTQQTPLPFFQPTQMVDSPPQDAHEVNMYIARQHSPWTNPQPALLPPPVVSQAPQQTPPPLSQASWYTTFLSDEDQGQIFSWDNTLTLYDGQFFQWENAIPPTGNLLDDDPLDRVNRTL